MAAELSPQSSPPRPFSAAHPTGPYAVQRLTLLGAAGSALLTVCSWWVGAVPAAWRLPPTAARIPVYLACYLGLAAVLASWLLLGRRLLHDHGATPRDLARYVVACAVPLLGAAPFGRDLWAYAAQGNVVAHGLDPYTAGPAAVPGAFTAEVSGRWVHSPSPYGPVWLRLSQLGTWASDGHPTVAALLLRLPAFAALLACVWAVHRLAGALGGRLAVGLWLGVASPLTIVLGVGGGHNDLPMLALGLVGLAVAARPGLMSLAVGAAIAAVGVLVKSPAAIAVAFTVPVWLHGTGAQIDLRRICVACATALAAALVTVGALTAATGLGFGWTKQVNADAQWVSWLSLPSGFAMLLHTVTGSQDLKAVDATMRDCRTAGEVLTVLVLVAAWLLALRGNRRAVLGWLAVAFGVAALLAPSVQPWYYAWALAVAGLVVAGRRALVVLAAVALVFPVMITPSGYGYESSWPAVPMLAGALLACWWALSAAHHDDTDHTGAEVRADDRAQLGDV